MAAALRFSERLLRGTDHDFEQMVQQSDGPFMSGDRLEMLFARASARSLDLKQLAGEASREIPSSSPRRRKLMQDLYGAPIKETIVGKSTRAASRASFYPTARLGHSLGGLTGPSFLAAMYSFALDGSVRTALYNDLRERVAQIARREEWPERIPGVTGAAHHYQDELTALVLDVDWFKPLFVLAQTLHGVNLYAIAMDVSEDLWRSKLLHYYVRIQIPYESWLGQARGHVERKLIEEFHREDIAIHKATA